MNIPWHFQPLLWPWPRSQQSTLPQDTRLMMMHCLVKLSLVHQFRRCISHCPSQNMHYKVTVWLHEPSVSALKTARSWWCTTISSLGSNVSAVPKTSSGQIEDKRTDKQTDKRFQYMAYTNKSLNDSFWSSSGYSEGFLMDNTVVNVYINITYL